MINFTRGSLNSLPCCVLAVKAASTPDQQCLPQDLITVVDGYVEKMSQKTEKYKRNVYIFMKYIININRYIFILNTFTDIFDSEKIHLNVRI